MVFKVGILLFASISLNPVSSLEFNRETLTLSSIANPDKVKTLNSCVMLRLYHQVFHANAKITTFSRTSGLLGLTFTLQRTAQNKRKYDKGTNKQTKPTYISLLYRIALKRRDHQHHNAWFIWSNWIPQVSFIACGLSCVFYCIQNSKCRSLKLD